MNPRFLHAGKKGIRIPFFSGSGVTAGFPSPAQDYEQQSISLDELLIKNKFATYCFDVVGDSMVDAFIPENCMVIVDRSVKAKHGDIILARVNDEYTVKMLYNRGGVQKLQACNKAKKYSDIIIHQETDFEVFGVVTKIVSDPRKCLR